MHQATTLQLLLEIVGERSETAKMMMTANLWCWGRKKYRQAMLCASQVAFVEDNLTNQKSLLPDFLRESMNFCCCAWSGTFLHLRYGVKYPTILTWKYFRLEEKKKSFTKTLSYLLRREISASTSTLLLPICTLISLTKLGYFQSGRGSIGCLPGIFHNFSICKTRKIPFNSKWEELSTCL